MTRLDHNRATAQIAARCGVSVDQVKNVIIWGNHSSTQFPDVKHAKVCIGGAWKDASECVKDDAWLKSEFISTIQKRGAEIIRKRKLSSAMSAAKAACDHMRDWFRGTQNDDWVSMAIISDGSYGTTKDLIYSFPVRIANGEWSIVKDLKQEDWAKEKMKATDTELQQERDEALAACA